MTTRIKVNSNFRRNPDLDFAKKVAFLDFNEKSTCKPSFFFENQSLEAT